MIQAGIVLVVCVVLVLVVQWLALRRTPQQVPEERAHNQRRSSAQDSESSSLQMQVRHRESSHALKTALIQLWHKYLAWRRKAEREEREGERKGEKELH
jgi:hypothetical protein